MSRETDKEAKRFKIYIERDIAHEPEWWRGHALATELNREWTWFF